MSNNPGYRFAYFRWRSFGERTHDESEDCPYVRCCRNIDFNYFDRLQAKP